MARPGIKRMCADAGQRFATAFTWKEQGSRISSCPVDITRECQASQHYAESRPRRQLYAQAYSAKYEQIRGQARSELNRGLRMSLP